MVMVMNRIIVSLFPKALQELKSISYMKIAAIAVVTALIANLFSMAAQRGIKGRELKDEPKSGLSQTTGQIPARSGEVLVGSTATKKMYINTDTLNIRIVDTATGVQWNSIYDDGKISEFDKSPLVVRFLGRDSQLYEWTAYKYCVSSGRYVINKINNGVQIVLDFMETDSFRLNEYMPQKISIRRFQEAFLDKLDQKSASGEISEEKIHMYRNVLELIYAKDEENGCYYNKFSGTPSASVSSLLIELTKDVGYSREALIKDNEEFGITVNIAEPAKFKIIMEAFLDENDLVIRIPTYEIINENDFYSIQNIVVYPGFGLASSDQVDEGYILVPDGAGALFKLNTFDGRYPEYTRPVYNNTYYDKLYEMTEYPEDLHMPVFGMMYQKGSGTMQGFMGIIEEGAETAYINVRLGTKDTESNGTPYNKVYASFDSMQYSRVKVFGPYSSNDARYLSTTGMIDMDFTIRYKLFEKDATYFNMAMEYREYLISKNNIHVSYEDKPKLFLEIIAALTIEDRILGVPYDKLISMTTYRELRDILEDMEGISKVIAYNGAYNGGINHSLLRKAELVDENGSAGDLDLLAEYIAENGDELFFAADITRVYKKGNGFNRKKHALYGFNRKPVEIMDYNPATGRFSRNSSSYYIISPKYLDSIVDGFLKTTKDNIGTYLKEMGNTYYANYNPREIINPVLSNRIVRENISRMSESRAVAIDNPNADKISYADYAVNISRECRDFGTMYCSIPFRQLVMNGLTEYTTLDVNMSSDRSRYYILQAFELGSYPKFTLCAKNVDVLQNTEFSYYFSIQYDALRDTIFNVYKEYRDGFDKIKSREIVSHNILQKNVFETRYANGSMVIVNYNKYPVTVKGLNIEALGYHIESGN